MHCSIILVKPCRELQTDLFSIDAHICYYYLYATQHKQVSVSTVNGFITLNDLEVSNCDMLLSSTDSGPIVLKDVVAKCSDSSKGSDDGKYCHFNNVVDISAGRGSVELERVVTDSVAVRTQEGRVKMTELTQLNPESGVTVTTQKGDVAIDYLVAAGNIQIETKSGDVNISIPMCNSVPAYFGTFQIAYGSVQQPEAIFYPEAHIVTKFDQLNDKATKKFVVMEDIDAAATTGQVTGTIGCHMEGQNNCAYANELLISTQSGKVRVTIDVSQNICTKAPAEQV